jgi:hypothetical protein
MPHGLGIETVQHGRANGRSAAARITVLFDLLTLALRFDLPINLFELAFGIMLGNNLDPRHRVPPFGAANPKVPTLREPVSQIAT